jgi:hypothetical protein
MHLVGFTIEIYYDARPYESQISLWHKVQSPDMTAVPNAGYRRISPVCLRRVVVIYVTL